VPRHTIELEKLGLEVTFFDIEIQSPELLEELERYIKSKIVIGASAGSMVFGSTIALIHEFDPQLNEPVYLTDFSGLGLTNINICPHTSRFVERYDNFLERIEAFEKRSNTQITRIDDGQAVFIDGDNVWIVY